MVGSTRSNNIHLPYSEYQLLISFHNLAMEFLSLCFLSMFILGSLSSHATARNLQDASMASKHEQWMAQYGRVYKDVKEKEMRFRIFKDNVARIEEFNNGGDKPYKLEINMFYKNYLVIE